MYTTKKNINGEKQNQNITLYKYTNFFKIWKTLGKGIWKQMYLGKIIEFKTAQSAENILKIIRNISVIIGHKIRN